jgi:formate dehydrogenase subunit gamma
MFWVERYKKQTRILHWVHTGSFIMLLVTGLILYTPFLAFLGQDGWTRYVHRIFAVLFILAPLFYLISNPKSAFQGIREAFKWGFDDLGWLLAAPRYYFFNDEKAMPPQGHMNTGQKMWWFLVVVCGLIFAITGLIMWFGKTQAPSAIIQWSIFVHDISFIVTGLMILVHIYLSVVHPLMRPLKTGAWSSMSRGKVSAEYAMSHHAKWYAEISRNMKSTEVKSGNNPK